MIDFEREPTDGLNPLRRYHEDIERKIGHYGDLVIATEKLIESYIGYGQSITAMGMIASSDLFPTFEAFENMDSRAVAERLTIFPLETLSPALESSNDLVGIRKWYGNLLESISTRVSKDHSEECLKSVGHAEGFSSCKSSLLCPWHYTAYQLRKDIVKPDFSRLAYLDENPNFAAGVAELKINLSVKYKLTQQEHSEYLKRRYWDMHFNAIGVEESLM